MIRFTLFYGILAGIIVMGFRNWFWSLCALVALTAVGEHQNFKENLFDIQGLKPWNVLCAFVVLQWITQRRADGLTNRTPPVVLLAFWCFFIAAVWGAVVAILDLEFLLKRAKLTTGSFAIEEFINPFKLLVPAALLFDGCRTSRRVISGLLMTIVMSMLFSIMIIKEIPVSSLLDRNTVLLYRLRIEKQIGLHPNDIVSSLVPGLWIMILLRQLIHRPIYRWCLLGCAGVTFVALLLTQSRTGMVALVAVALGLGVLRYHKLGLATLGLSLMAVIALPSLSANWSRGFSEETVDGAVSTDVNEVTNGRYELWQNVLKDIGHNPLIGNGRLYWFRNPSANFELWTHPHNAYLEIWVENGIFALIVILICFAGLFYVASRLLRRGRTPLEVTVGACATACLITHFVVGLGGRAFTPRLTAVITYCVCAMALRLYYSGGPRRQMQGLRSGQSGKAVPGSRMQPSIVRYARR